MANSELAVKINVDVSGFESAIGTITDQIAGIAGSLADSGIGSMFSSIAEPELISAIC